MKYKPKMLSTDHSKQDVKQAKQGIVVKIQLY